MSEIPSSVGLNMEAFLNQITASIGKSDLEEKKAISAQIRVESSRIRDKREERIENLTQQMKGVGSGGGCLKILKVTCTLIDVLAKPLSAFNLANLRLTLSKTVEMLREAQSQGKLLNLQIDGQKILKVLQDLKTHLQDDTRAYQEQDEKARKESQKILRIIEEIHDTFQSTLKI